MNLFKLQSIKYEPHEGRSLPPMIGATTVKPKLALLPKHDEISFKSDQFDMFCANMALGKTSPVWSVSKSLAVRRKPRLCLTDNLLGQGRKRK